MTDETTPTTAPTGEASATRAALMPGDLAGEYVIQRMLASGGCGAVYAAEHRTLGRRVAVKLLHGELVGSPEMVERFVREARAVNLVRHPNIVDIYEFGELPDRRPFLVMELLEGQSLDALLAAHGALSPTEVLELITPVCAALSAAHAVGVIHRDLKASNIFVATRGDERVIKLLDFGIAKLIEPDPNARGLTAVGTLLGTPYAMAPEQIRAGTIDARTDVYALGILLYHLLTGRHPFAAADTAEMERLHLSAPAPRPSAAVPLWPAIDEVVLRCLEKAPERRYESVQAVLDALRAAVRAQPAESGRRSGRAAMAVGIFVEVRLRDEQGDFDDELLDRMGSLFDQAGQRLREAGFVLLLETGSAVLGARLIPDAAAASVPDRERAVALAGELGKSLAVHVSPGGRMQLGVCVHVDRAIARQQGDGEQILGGPIINIGSWAPQEKMRGVCATREAVEGLAHAVTGERYVTIG